MVESMRIVKEENKYLDCVEIGFSEIKAISKNRLEILELLSREPMYPAKIARELGVEIQSIYYHIRMLEKAGLIKFHDYVEIGGAAAKRYSLRSNAISIIINPKWRSFISKKRKPPKILEPFIRDSQFNGKIVVGSPDPHGKYRARGSELAMMELTMLLGQYMSFSTPLYLLDTQVKNLNKKENLILAGGPKVNTLVDEINKGLPIYFRKSTFEIYSKLTKKVYGENVGVVQLFDNPFNKAKRVLFIGGLNYNGTRAAVLSIVKYIDEISKGNKKDSSVIAKVVEGFDEDGDGVVDSIEFLE